MLEKVILEAVVRKHLEGMLKCELPNVTLRCSQEKEAELCGLSLIRISHGTLIYNLSFYHPDVTLLLPL